MKIASWNIRGLNHPLKQNEVQKLLCKYDVDICGLMECKVEEARVEDIMRLKFHGWKQCNNFALHQPGRILILWNPSKVDATVVDMNSQLIHLSITCKVSSQTFLVTFVYGWYAHYHH